MSEIKTLFKGEFANIITPDFAPTYEILHESDIVHVIPIANGRIGIRKEWVPPYTLKDTTGEEKYYTVISGHIEEGESDSKTALRELLEEAGMKVKDGKVLRIFNNIPVCKSTTMRVSLFIVEVDEYDIGEPEGDGSIAEEKSETVWVTLSDFQKILSKGNIDLLLVAAYNIVSRYYEYRNFPPEGVPDV